jgi:hypothetical protein
LASSIFAALQWRTIVELNQAQEEMRHAFFMTHQDSADSMAAAAIEQLYARTAIRLAQEHIAHCDGESCDISLQVLCEMAEKAGAKFTEIEKKLFF